MSLDTKAAVDELINARAALYRLNLQGDPDYHAAMRHVAFAAGELGLAAEWLNEMAGARVLFRDQVEEEA